MRLIGYGRSIPLSGARAASAGKNLIKGKHPNDNVSPRRRARGVQESEGAAELYISRMIRERRALHSRGLRFNALVFPINIQKWRIIRRLGFIYMQSNARWPSITRAGLYPGGDARRSIYESVLQMC